MKNDFLEYLDNEISMSGKSDGRFGKGAHFALVQARRKYLELPHAIVKCPNCAETIDCMEHKTSINKALTEVWSHVEDLGLQLDEHKQLLFTVAKTMKSEPDTAMNVVKWLEKDDEKRGVTRNWYNQYSVANSISTIIGDGSEGTGKNKKSSGKGKVKG